RTTRGHISKSVDYTSHVPLARHRPAETPVHEPPVDTAPRRRPPGDDDRLWYRVATVGAAPQHHRRLPTAGRGRIMADPVEDIIGDYRAFVAQQRDRLSARGIDIAPYPLSHLAYRVPEWEQYVHVRTLLERHATANVEN